MPDAVGVGLIAAAAVLVTVVVALLFSRAPERRLPPEGTAAALLALAKGDRTKARRLLVHVVERGTAPVEAMLVLGHLLREQGDPARALALHQAVLARPTLDPERRRLAELEVADDLLAAGLPQRVEDRLAALDEHFIDGELLERRALALQRLGDRTGAADAWTRRARVDAKDPEKVGRCADAIGEIARETLREGKVETAQRLAKRALELDASRPVAHLVLGDAALAQGRPNDAQLLWEAGLRAAPGSASLLLGRVLEVALQKGRLESLVETLEALREARPDDVPLWRAAADLRLRRGDRESFFALLEDPPVEAAAQVETWAGWMRHLHGRDDAHDLRRLLAAMPDAFGPTAWRCRDCGEEESEPRLACGRCGAVHALRPVLSRPVPPAALPGGAPR